MEQFRDLFARQSVIGAQIEKLINEKALTKAELCKKAGISRPTLDKLLAGMISSANNYEKHIRKVLNALDVSVEYFSLNNKMGNQLRKIRSIRRLQQSDISNVTGISMERLKEIEAGAEMTLAEERDLALCLSTSVYVLRGVCLLDAQIASMDDFIRFVDDEVPREYSGFWGHVGILLENQKDYMWYPITANTKERIYNGLDQNSMVIPCMNNKVLFINFQYLKEIRLLDDACDTSFLANCDTNISEGEIPPVVYESLEDYIYDDTGAEKISPFFKRYLEQLIKERGWDDDSLEELLNMMQIIYGDGNTRLSGVIFDEYETISDEIDRVLNYGDAIEGNKWLLFEDQDENELLLNWEKIAMLELPYAKLEEKLYQDYLELRSSYAENNN